MILIIGHWLLSGPDILVLSAQWTDYHTSAHMKKETIHLETYAINLCAYLAEVVSCCIIV